MIKNIIAVDIDEVLAETLKAILEKYNYTWKWNKVKWEDLINYNLWELPNLWLTKYSALRMFVKFQMWSGLSKKIKSVDWAKEKILELKNKWYKMFAVTARLSRVKFSTKLWLRRNFPNCFDKVVFANFFTSRARKKSDICKEICASIIFEDNLDTCIDCANNWIKSFLLDKPWNQCDSLPDWITRVYSWDEINL